MTIFQDLKLLERATSVKSDEMIPAVVGAGNDANLSTSH